MPSRSHDIKCFYFQGHGHIASECPNKKVMILRENGEIESEGENDGRSGNEQIEELVLGEQIFVVRRTLNMQAKMGEAEKQRENIFHT